MPGRPAPLLRVAVAALAAALAAAPLALPSVLEGSGTRLAAAQAHEAVGHGEGASAWSHDHDPAGDPTHDHEQSCAWCALGRTAPPRSTEVEAPLPPASALGPVVAGVFARQRAARGVRSRAPPTA